MHLLWSLDLSNNALRSWPETLPLLATDQLQVSATTTPKGARARHRRARLLTARPQLRA